MRDPLVLVPGIDGSGLMYHRQVPRLERRFAVTTVRLRDEAARMTELVDDLHRAVSAAARDDAPVTLVGESFGGALAMTYALAHPGRVGRLVILNSFACIESRARLWLAHQLLRAAPWGVMPLMRELNAKRMYSPQTGRDEIRVANELLRASTRQGYRSRIGMLLDYDLRTRLGELAPPVLFLAADRDTLVPAVAQARLMRSLAPRSTLRILEGHGHSCLVAPDLDLAAILDEWIDGAG
ncbi:MAG TPA: alpha/beta hydrolase [Vicinamibacterales bacterium]|nr:alpha/beta hydrolase [Vicinamibacterales bacterium]